MLRKKCLEKMFRTESTAFWMLRIVKHVERNNHKWVLVDYWTDYCETFISFILCLLFSYQVPQTRAFMIVLYSMYYTLDDVLNFS